MDLYHAHSFWKKYVFCQDAKVIAIGLVLSWLMRLQLGFPEAFSFITPDSYY